MFEDCLTRSAAKRYHACSGTMSICRPPISPRPSRLLPACPDGIHLLHELERSGGCANNSETSPHPSADESEYGESQPAHRASRSVRQKDLDCIAGCAILSNSVLMLSIRKVLILIAAALVTANAQCVAACTASDCSRPARQSDDSGNLPPCHRHHAPEHSSTTKLCIESVVIVDSRAPRLPSERNSQITVNLSCSSGHRLVAALPADQIMPAPAPTILDRPSTLILRI